MTDIAPASMYRSQEGLGLWDHRGKVAAVGIGHSPTSRRWEETPETSLGAWSILALRNAMEDAGVSPRPGGRSCDQPGEPGRALVAKAVPEDFANMFQLTDNPDDGLSKMSAEWVLKNMPELTNVNFTMYGPGCMSNAICVAAQAVGEGLTNTCLVLTARNNLAGRYGQYGAAAADTVTGRRAVDQHLGRGRTLLPGVLVQPVHPQVRRQPRHDGPLRRKLQAQRPAVPGGVLRSEPA